MNIDIEAFKKWYEKQYDGSPPGWGFNNRNEWYVSPAEVLAHMMYCLEEFNKGALAESA